MASILSDGSVIPSWLTPVEVESLGYVIDQQLSNNATLKLGYVVAIHWPDEVGYQTFKEPVYDILSYTSVDVEAATWQHFRNVRWGGGLGSNTKDFTDIRFTYPKEVWTPNTAPSIDMLKQCSAVTLLCLNGQSVGPYIVGFARHPYREVGLTKDDGYHYRWDFNGMSSIIDKDGQYKVMFTGAILDPSTNTYKEAPAETTGTFFQFTKEGNWLVDDAKGERILLDKKNASLNIQARKMAVDISEGDYSTNVKGKMFFQSEDKAVFNGKKVYIGKDGAKDPLVLGKKLTDALGKLIQTLTTAPLGVLGSAPVMPSPALLAGLNAWKAQYCTPTSPFLSKKGFVE